MLKNVTLSAEDRLIAQAHRRAQRERKTLNAAFREWLVRNSNLRRISSKQGIAKVNG